MNEQNNNCHFCRDFPVVEIIKVSLDNRDGNNKKTYPVCDYCAEEFGRKFWRIIEETIMW